MVEVIWSGEDLDQCQEPESTCGNAGYGRNVLDQLEPS